MKLLMASGTGGVGKTSFCKELLKVLDPYFKTFFVPSPTREIAAKHGYTSEAQTLALPPDKFLALQFEYIQAITSRVTEALKRTDIDLVVSDRHLADYVSYTMVNYQSGDPLVYYNLIDHSSTFQRRTLDTFNFSAFVVDCPFPVNWPTADAYRVSPFLKNYVWDQIRQKVLETTGWTDSRFESLDTNSRTVEDRVAGALRDTELYHWLKS